MPSKEITNNMYVVFIDPVNFFGQGNFFFGDETNRVNKVSKWLSNGKNFAFFAEELASRIYGLKLNSNSCQKGYDCKNITNNIFPDTKVEVKQITNVGLDFRNSIHTGGQRHTVNETVVIPAIQEKEYYIVVDITESLAIYLSPVRTIDLIYLHYNDNEFDITNKIKPNMFYKKYFGKVKKDLNFKEFKLNSNKVETNKEILEEIRKAPWRKKTKPIKQSKQINMIPGIEEF